MSASSELVWAGVEAGGTKFALSIAKGNPTNIIEKHMIQTESPEETLPKVIEWLRCRKFDAIGVASFGPVDLHRTSPKYGYITSTPKRGWADTDILGALKCFSCPKGFDTDVNAAALAEKAWNHSSVGSCAYVTVGGGVGVGLVINGLPVHGLVHPEMGHIYVPRAPGDSFEGTCPFHKGCLEGFVCIGALSARLGIAPAEIPNVPDEHPVWEFVSYYLAQLCVALVLAVSPEVIVLGGGVLKRACLFPRIRSKVQELLHGYVASPSITTDRIAQYIVHEGFGENAGVVGSLELARMAYWESIRAKDHVPK